MATLDAWDDEDEWTAGVAEIQEKLRISEATAAPEPKVAQKASSNDAPIVAAAAAKPAKVSNVKVIEKPKLPPTTPVAPPMILARAPEDGGSMAAAHRKRQLHIRSTEEEIDSAILSCLETHRNRMQLLEIEEKICKFAQSEENETVFPPVHNSYWRLIHFRVADRFRLGHTFTDDTGALIFYKTEDFSLPRTLLMDMDLDALYRHYCNREAMRDGPGLGSRNGSGNSIDSYGEEGAGGERGGGGGGGGARDSSSSGGGKKVMMLRRASGANSGGGKGGREGGGAGGRGSNGKGGKGASGRKGGDTDGDKERAYAEARARIFSSSSGGGGGGGGGGPPSVFGGKPPGR